MGSVAMGKSMAFAIRIVRLYKYLCEGKKEFVMSRQLLKSGTSIGANLREAVYAQSISDFISKNSIALKETAETEYWLELLHETGYLKTDEYESIRKDCSEIAKILIAIIKTTKSNKT